MVESSGQITMKESSIKDIDDLYVYLKKGKISWSGDEKSVVFQYELSKLKTTVFKGKWGFAKNLIVRIYPLRYILACRECRRITSFREESFRRKIRRQAKTDLLSNIEQYRKAYGLLDKKSKRVYLDMLLYRLTGNYKYSIHAMSSNQQYFSDKIHWKKNMTIIDCGAFTGDTLAAFMNRKIGIKTYYLYELDTENYSECKKMCKMAEDIGITVYPRKKGVYSSANTLYFESRGDSSRLVEYLTETSISVVSIDEDVMDTVDFIKMDIEGSELEAINGTAETIKRDHPILAICIYHKQEDFWKIPLRIKEICPDYQKFWVEQYSLWDIETVLFAAL